MNVMIEIVYEEGYMWTPIVGNCMHKVFVKRYTMSI